MLSSDPSLMPPSSASTVDRAVQREQTADTPQHESERQLDGRDVGRDDDQQREAGAPIRHPRADDADRRDVDAILELQLESARVLAFGAIEDQEPAAGEAAALQGETSAVRRLEAQCDVEGTGVAALKRNVRVHADAVEHELERPEVTRYAGAELEPQLWRAIRCGSESHGDRVDANRAERRVRVQRDLERRAAFEPEALSLPPLDADRHVHGYRVVADDGAEKTVALAGSDHQLEPDEIRAQSERHSPCRRRRARHPQQRTRARCGKQTDRR